MKKLLNLITVQVRRKVWKSGGGACIIVVGITCPPGWDRVNCLAKNRGPSPPRLRRAWLILHWYMFIFQFSLILTRFSQSEYFDNVSLQKNICRNLWEIICCPFEVTQCLNFLLLKFVRLKNKFRISVISY